MLTIVELAGFCGVSTRTVRYYQEQGLMPEPQRDTAGYRRYGASDVVRLSRIVALTAAGAPLARIGELIEGPPDTFAAGVAEVDRGLRDEIARLRRLRTTLAGLDSADRLALPPVLADVIDRLRASDAAAEHVDLYRDAWILIHAVVPDHLADWISESVYRDPEYVDLLTRQLELATVDADDPRVDALAEESIAWTVRTWEENRWANLSLDDPRAVEILAERWIMTPAWTRLTELIMAGLAEHGIDQHLPDPPPSGLATDGPGAGATGD